MPCHFSLCEDTITVALTVAEAKQLVLRMKRDRCSKARLNYTVVDLVLKQLKSAEFKEPVLKRRAWKHLLMLLLGFCQLTKTFSNTGRSPTHSWGHHVQHVGDLEDG